MISQGLGDSIETIKVAAQDSLSDDDDEDELVARLSIRVSFFCCSTSVE